MKALIVTFVGVHPVRKLGWRPAMFSATPMESARRHRARFLRSSPFRTMGMLVVPSEAGVHPVQS